MANITKTSTPQNLISKEDKKVEQSTISKDNTIAKDDENSFENIVKKAVDNKTTVSIVKNGKRISKFNC